MFLNQTIPPPFIKGWSVIFFGDSQTARDADINITDYISEKNIFIKANKIIIALLDAENFTEKIADARRKADVVFVAVNDKSLGKTLIDSGADVVLDRSKKIFNVETYKNRPIVSGAAYIVISKRGVEQIFAADDFAETKFNPPVRADSKLEPVELFSPKKIAKTKINTLGGGGDVEKFKREFDAANGVIFFMLRTLNPIDFEASGIEISAFRRAKLFREHFGIDATIITNRYQNDLFDRRDEYDSAVSVMNFYDYFQEINRTAEPRKVYIEQMHDGWKIERLDRDIRVLRQDNSLAMYCAFTHKNQQLGYINFFDENYKKYRRDTYDASGFLSRRQEFDIATDLPTEIFYYRPDGSTAVHEIYHGNNLKSLELVDRSGDVTKTFTKFDDALSHWIRQLLSDKDKNYFLIGDRTPEWHKTYSDIQSARLENVRVIHQVHSLHVTGDFNPLTAPTKNNYRYLTDKNIKADAIITLTEQQKIDIAERYKLPNVYAIPHPLREFHVDKAAVNPFNVVMVGRLAEEKGHSKAIAAFKLVLEKIPQAQLHFYGNGPLKAELQNKIDILNLGDSIMLKGFAKNVAEIFSKATCSICASSFEGFALAVQESLQNNCPVVSFDCLYGARDMIEDGVNGFLVPINGVAAMADKIIKILTDSGLRDKLAANCARSVEKFYPEVVADKWAEFFCKLMEEKGA